MRKYTRSIIFGNKRQPILPIIPNIRLCPIIQNFIFSEIMTIGFRIGIIIGIIIGFNIVLSIGF